MTEEFIDGLKPGPDGTKSRTPEEQNVLEDIKKKMKDTFQFNDQSKFVFAAGQNCSDMVVQVGMCNVKFPSFFSITD